MSGIAVATGARVAGTRAPGEVLVSQTVKDLVAGSGIPFVDRGTAELKGVPGEWRLYAVELANLGWCPSCPRSKPGAASSIPLSSNSPIEQAGPAHIATLKTFDPPLSALDGEGFEGVRAAGEAVPASDRRRRARADGAPDERRAV